MKVASRPTATFPAGWSTPASTPREFPNIFIVIADGHGRADVLRDGYGYDAAPFLGQLTSLGFEVASKSGVNYLDTQQSLPSFFSGSHLADLGVDMSQHLDSELLSTALRDNPAAHRLKALGYALTSIPSGYDHLAERNVDRDLNTGQMSHLEYRLLQASQADLWLPQWLKRTWLASLRERTVASVDAIEQVARSLDRQPQLVVAHLPLPHPPNVLDASCSDRPVDASTFPVFMNDPTLVPDETRIHEDAIATGEQTACVDRMLADAADTIVTADPTAIVLILSDHGPDVRLNWARPELPGLRDRVANLFAARTPGHPALFPDDITLVNVMPILFNTYFGTALTLNANDSYINRPNGPPSRVDLP